MTTPTMPTPTRPIGLWARLRRTCDRRRSGRATADGLTGPARLALLDSRIDNAIQEVYAQVHQHEHEGKVHRRDLNDGIVALVDRLHERIANPGQAEDGLDDGRATHQAADLGADHGDDRDQRIAQRM